MVATSWGSNAEPAEPTGVPQRNHGAEVAMLAHHTAVAAVIASIDSATVPASVPSASSARGPKPSLRTVTTAATVHSAAMATTRAQTPKKARLYPREPPFRWGGVRRWAVATSGMPAASTSSVAAPARSTWRRILGQPPARRKRTEEGRATTAPATTARPATVASHCTTVKASTGSARACAGTEPSKCSASLAKLEPATTKATHAHRTRSEPPLMRLVGAAA